MDMGHGPWAPERARADRPPGKYPPPWTYAAAASLAAAGGLDGPAGGRAAAAAGERAAAAGEGATRPERALATAWASASGPALFPRRSAAGTAGAGPQ